MISPASTSRPPIQSTTTIAPNTSVITQAAMPARARAWPIAASNACSTRSRNRRRSPSSWANACTVRIAFRVSSAWPPSAPIRSCASRDSRRTRRPITTIGTTTSGTTIRIRPVSLGLVTSSRARPPISSRRLRKACDRLALITDWMTAVSLVRRASTSPIRVSSKKPGERPVTWA